MKRKDIFTIMNELNQASAKAYWDWYDKELFDAITGKNHIRKIKGEKE